MTLSSEILIPSPAVNLSCFPSTLATADMTLSEIVIPSPAVNLSCFPLISKVQDIVLSSREIPSPGDNTSCLAASFSSRLMSNLSDVMLVGLIALGFKYVIIERLN